MADDSLLIGDIGGTNARFALARRDQPGFLDAMTVPCSDFESAHQAIEFYLDEKGAAPPGIICLAAAGPVVARTIRITNNHWTLAVDNLLADFSGAQVRLLNDFESIAYSVPHLEESDYMQVGLPDKGLLPADNFTVGILGPGTGLGAVGLKVVAGNSVPIAGEAGHIGFAPASQVQVEILSALREHYGRVSAERLVCGTGIENHSLGAGPCPWPGLAATIGQRDLCRSQAGTKTAGRPKPCVCSSRSWARWRAISRSQSAPATAYFIAGGIVPRHPDLFANSGFRAGFENKGRISVDDGEYSYPPHSA